MKKKQNDFFWVSYSDLMTSLFFIMLVLFVLVFSIMRYQQEKLKIELAEYKKVEEIKKALNNLNEDYFRFDSINKRHELRVDVLFPSWEYEIPEYIKDELFNAGQELKNVVENVQSDEDIKYLIIIEGMAAKAMMKHELWKNTDPDYIERTYLLSYNRSKALYEFWKESGIYFDEDIYEIIIAGSGWFGAGRYTGKEEGKNKRFLIQIIPKVGKIDYNIDGKNISK